MIKHLFKMVWNRKRWNILILLEIFLSFLVLFAISTIGLNLWNNQRNPIGFDYQDVWLLSIGMSSGATSDEHLENTFDLYRQIQNFIANQKPIQNFGMMNTPPYRGSSWTSTLNHDQKQVNTYLTFVSEGVMDTLDIKLSEGRWFEDGDFVDQTVYPLVVNQKFADDLDVGGSVVGQRVFDKEDGELIEYEIIGVMEHFRKEGELKKPSNMGFLPLILNGPIWIPRYALLEMNNSVDPTFEESLLAGLNQIAPQWSFKVNPYAKSRQKYMLSETKGLKIMALVAFFLLLMVAMGLIGVLWQHVTRRTVELGVRRAKGATQRNIYRQIMGEFLVIASIALALGLIIVIQIPILGLFKEKIGTSLLIGSFGVSSLAIYLLTILASFYPGWLATKIMPAEALHYE